MDNKTIQSQLDANAKALEWGRVYLRGKDLEDFRNKLIGNRIKLKRLKYANNFNPAAAIFGESQVGKSYMVDCLLTSDTQVLNIYDGEGKATGFIESINPLGGGKEATSLISRFSIQKVWKDKDYPIRASMLTPIDVVTVLADSYYNDVINHDMPKTEAIKEEIERLKAQYQSLPPVQNHITEDEIYELRDYLKSNLVLRCDGFRSALIDSKYFEELALIINKVDVKQWTDVFSFLWNHQPIISDVFSNLIATLQRMGFSREVYIKMDAVLRDPGTILHVDRIYELFGITELKDEQGNLINIQVASEPYMDVLTQEGKKLSQVSKSEFCALATELAFSIMNEEKSQEDDRKRFLKDKPFLEFSDILDFPGARSRMMIEESTITSADACNMVIRGKIAYLFNKYSQQYLITNLLFCHHDVQSNVPTLSSLMRGWVENTVGNTASKRNEFMQKAEVSPLFIIGTKFNIDLTKTPLEQGSAVQANKMENKDYRWTKRFGILGNIIAPSAENDWFTNWTPGRNFDNLYLLRSYEYSCMSNIFEGYKEKGDDNIWHLVRNADGTLRGEKRISNEYVGFLKDLKTSFLNNQFVKDHFHNPSKSWDMAVCEGENDTAGWKGHDGSEWIIENLTRSARNTKASRDNTFATISDDVFHILVKALIEQYYDDNSDLELKKQIETAGMIALSFDALFGKDKYFFPDFISAMLIGEEDLHDTILDVINNLKVVEQTDLSMLVAIRAAANIDNNKPFEENVRSLMRTYVCDTKEELEVRLRERGTSLEDVINPPKVMSFSRLIADAVERLWIDTRLNIDNYQEFVDRGLSEKELKKMLENLRVLYTERIRLSDRIASKLHPFVSSAQSVDDMTDMLADICAEMINKFVNTMGSAYYDNELWSDVKKTVAHNGFDVQIPDAIDGQVTYDEERLRSDLPQIFDTFDKVDEILNAIPVDVEKLMRFSNYQEYHKWRELMRVSFLATRGIPKYDINMNNALRRILSEGIMEAESLQPLVKGTPELTSMKSLHVNEKN